jgi:hypothetical protein
VNTYAAFFGTLRYDGQEMGSLQFKETICKSNFMLDVLNEIDFEINVFKILGEMKKIEFFKSFLKGCHESLVSPCNIVLNLNITHLTQKNIPLFLTKVTFIP